MPAPRICFDRVIPSSFAPARAMAHAAALSDYRSAVQQRVTAVRSVSGWRRFSERQSAGKGSHLAAVRQHQHHICR